MFWLQTSARAVGEGFGPVASRHRPGAGRLASVLEGLMVTVQDEHDGSQQLVHPLQAETVQEGGQREEIWFTYGQSFFNSDARGF